MYVGANCVYDVGDFQVWDIAIIILFTGSHQHNNLPDCRINRIFEIKKINTNQPVLNNHTLAEFLEDPTKVIEDSPSYRSMASYAEEKKVQLDQLKKQMGDYELNQCKIEDKIYFLKTSKTGSTSVANILTRFGIRKWFENHFEF